MTSPAHAIAGMLAFSRARRPTYTAAAVFGSVLPDLPMVVFYAVHKVFLHTLEGEVWTHFYFLPAWQSLFDGFHSLPLIGVAALVAWRLQAPSALVVSGAMALHVALDLPFHHDDAHRHFFPFSDWRFHSPLSYWDPRHFGDTVFWIESALVLIGALLLLRRHRSAGPRATALGIAAAYVGFVGYALWVWVL